MNKIVRLLVLDMRKWMAAAFFVMALLLVASNQLLVRQIQDAKKEVVAVRRLYNEPPSGVELQPITGLNLQGDRVSIRYGEGEVGTVLLVGAAECFYTDANWKFWENLRAFDWFRRQRVVFVDLSKVLSPGFFTSKGVSLSDVMRVDAEVKSQPWVTKNIRLRKVAQMRTLIIGAALVVLGSLVLCRFGLTMRWTHASSQRLVLPQTWSADLDSGQLDQGPADDLWLQAASESELSIRPLNRATLVLLDPRTSPQDGCTQHSTLETRVPAAMLSKGSRILVKTNEGNCAVLRVIVPIQSRPGTFVFECNVWVSRRMLRIGGNL